MNISYSYKTTLPAENSLTARKLTLKSYPILNSSHFHLSTNSNQNALLSPRHPSLPSTIHHLPGPIHRPRNRLPPIHRLRRGPKNNLHQRNNHHATTVPRNRDSTLRFPKRSWKSIYSFHSLHLRWGIRICFLWPTYAMYWGILGQISVGMVGSFGGSYDADSGVYYAGH